jgi:hypothetical protein
MIDDFNHLVNKNLRDLRGISPKFATIVATLSPIGDVQKDNRQYTSNKILKI